MKEREKKSYLLSKRKGSILPTMAGSNPCEITVQNTYEQNNFKQ